MREYSLQRKIADLIDWINGHAGVRTLKRFRTGASAHRRPPAAPLVLPASIYSPLSLKNSVRSAAGHTIIDSDNGKRAVTDSNIILLPPVQEVNQKLNEF